MQNTLTRYKNATFNFRTNFQWNRNVETGTQLPKPPSKNIFMSLSNQSFWHVLFHVRVNEKRVPDHLRFAFWNKWLNYEDNLCRITIHEKIIVSKLTMAIKLYVNVNWETTFLPLWREELNKIFFFMNVNAYSNINISNPASFDTISTKIAQFC